MRKALPFILLIILLPACLGSYLMSTSQQKMLAKAADISYLPPSPVLKITTLGYKDLASDYWFLKVYTFYGETLHRTVSPRITKDEWYWMIRVLNTVTDLDPYFLDPYYFNNAFITWEAGLVNESNLLLEKGSNNRFWDALLPFYAGFNYYYFLNDGDKSFYYLKEASKRAGGNLFYDGLAARVAYKANKTELAIMYLEQQIHQAELEGLGNQTINLQRRLDLLKGIHQIELAIESYRRLFGKQPATINELVTIGVLTSVPKEPNGGGYYLDQNGKVHSTKDLK